MEELIDKLQKISNIKEIENNSSINSNDLLYAIVKSERYELLTNSNIRINIKDSESLIRIIDYLIEEENVYLLHKNNYYFTKEELNTIFNLIIKKYHYSNQFDIFLMNFFKDKEELNNFIKENARIQYAFENLGLRRLD